MDDIEDVVSAPRLPADAPPPGTEVVPRKTSKRQARQRKAAMGYDIPGTHSIYIKTYGCSHNFSDGEYMAGQLAAQGYGVTEEWDAADAYILNSCTVKNPSEAHFHTLVGAAKYQYVVASGLSCRELCSQCRFLCSAVVLSDLCCSADVCIGLSNIIASSDCNSNHGGRSQPEPDPTGGWGWGGGALRTPEWFYASMGFVGAGGVEFFFF